MTEQLWAPWRLEYVAGAGGDSTECIFCAKQAAGDDDASLIVHRGERMLRRSSTSTPTPTAT